MAKESTWKRTAETTGRHGSGDAGKYFLTLLHPHNTLSGPSPLTECAQSRTDYFVVGTTAHYDDWETTGHAIDCATTDNCNNMQAHLEQECTTTKWEVGTAVSARLEKEFGWATASAGIEIKGSAGQDKQLCTNSVSTG